MAKELGVHYSTFRDWVKEYEKDGVNAFPGSGNLKPEDEEIRRLCREVANLKEENEILKKPRPTCVRKKQLNFFVLYKR